MHKNFTLYRPRENRVACYLYLIVAYFSGGRYGFWTNVSSGSLIVCLWKWNEWNIVDIYMSVVIIL